MKILFINPLDKRYGSTYRSRNIVRALIDLGYDVQYVESNFNETIFQNAISIEQKDNFSGYLNATLKRILLVLKLDYDLLYLQKFIPLVAPCLIIGKLRGRRCIVDWDDLDFCFQKDIFRKVIVFLCEHIFTYFADCITTHSQRLKEYAQRLGIKKIKIVNQIVDFDSFEISDKEKQSLKEKIGATDKKVLCFLGTLTQGGARDLDIIIRSVGAALKANNDLFLLIVGGGPLEKNFSDMLTQYGLVDNSCITGLIPHKEVGKYLSIADVGLIYMSDNIGNRMRVSFKVLEYLKLGVPVVGRLVGETKDRFLRDCLLCDNKNDFLKKISNPLTNGIKQYEAKRENNLEIYNFNHMKLSLENVIKRREKFQTKSEKESEKMYRRNLFDKRKYGLGMDGYENLIDYQNSILDRCINEVIGSDFLRKKTILELGSESGHLSLNILNKYDSSLVVTTDLCDSLIDAVSFLASKMKYRLVPKICIIDNVTIPFKTNSFDFVIACNCLHHLPEPASSIKEVQRVLKNNGLFFLMLEPFYPKYLPILRFLFSREHKKLGLSENIFSLNKWLYFLSKFEIINLELYPPQRLKHILPHNSHLFKYLTGGWFSLLAKKR